MDVEMWRCHNFVNGNGERVHRKTFRECDGKPVEHMMSTCTVGESTHSRVVLMSSVLVL